MKRRSSSLFAIAFGLSLSLSVGCGSQVAMPTPDRIATRVQEEKSVAATLTAHAPTDAPAPTATLTPIPPTGTSTRSVQCCAKTGNYEGPKPPVSFKVEADGNIHDFVMTAPFGTDTCKVTIDRIPVDTDGTFFFTEFKPGSIKQSVLDLAKSMGFPTPETKQIGGEEFTISTDLKGKFDDGGKVSGHVTITMCEEGGIVIGNERSWSAEWKSP